MKLNDFITMKEPWAYNFEFECGDEEYKKLEIFMRYFIYKTLPGPPASWLENTAIFIKNNFGYRPIYDPDGSDSKAYYQIVIEIYNHLWSWNCPAEPEQREYAFAEVDGNIFSKCYFGSDTMNSVQKPLNLFVGVSSLYQTINKCYENDTVKDIDTKCKDEKGKIWSKIAQYIDCYHTLGNFILVPAGFNRYRSNDNKIEDFWDKSLDFLKNGYKTTVDDYNYKKHKKNNRTVDFDKCKFNEYINYFFLWDYVEHKDNGYIVRSISHKDWESKQFSPDFFDETQKIIERRGRFMTAMLMLEQDEHDLYKEIQEWLVAKNGNGELPFFDGMNDAAGKILEKYGEKIPKNAKGILTELEADCNLWE